MACTGPGGAGVLAHRCALARRITVQRAGQRRSPIVPAHLHGQIGCPLQLMSRRPGWRAGSLLDRRTPASTRRCSRSCSGDSATVPAADHESVTLPTCTWSSTSATRSASAPKGPASGPAGSAGRGAGDSWAAWLACRWRTQGSVSNRPGMQPLKRSSLARARLSGTHRGSTPLEKTSSRSPIAYTFR
jgi:hypothetical protein